MSDRLRHPDPAATDTPPRWRVRALAALVLIAVAAGFFVARSAHPAEHRWLPECPSRLVGVYCPGCGSARATHFLAAFQPADALRHNPLAVALGLPIALLITAWAARTVVTGRPARLPELHPLLGAAVLLAVLALGILRNIPLPALDPLRPPGPIIPAADHQPAP